ncbi:MAG: septal ring lytic transglycosylase RlpA family protein [Betaproteobacteria bacterium]
MGVKATSRRPSWSECFGWLLAAFFLVAVSPAEAAPKKSVTAKKTAKVHPHRAKKSVGAASTANPSADAEQSETQVAEVQPRESGDSTLRGAASYYSYSFHGRRAASGERFDAKAMTAASNRFPLGSWVAVRHLGNDRCVVVRINDRMHARHRVRIIDLSRGAAEKLRMISAGVAMVRVARLNEAPGKGDDGCSPAPAKRPECEDCIGAEEPLVLTPSLLPTQAPALDGAKAPPELSPAISP